MRFSVETHATTQVGVDGRFEINEASLVVVINVHQPSSSKAEEQREVHVYGRGRPWVRDLEELGATDAEIEAARTLIAMTRERLNLPF